jgi:hypothetical protein
MLLTGRQKLAGLALAATLGLSACEGQKASTNLDRTVSFQTNAYMSAFLDDGKPWEQAYTGNADNLPSQRSYSLDNAAGTYGLLFACPSQHDGQAHRIYLYYYTTAELRVNNHLCRLPDEQRDLRMLHGSVIKRTTANVEGVTSTENEAVMLAFSRDVSLIAYEGFATKFVGSRKDILAYKGVYQPTTNTVEPEYFYRFEDTLTDLRESGYVIDFISNSMPYDGARASTVSIEGLAETDTVDAVVGFGSKNRTFLPLKKSTLADFDYKGVPAEYIDNPLSSVQAKEGHELHATVTSVDGHESELVAFFNRPQNITMTVPTPSTEPFDASAVDGEKTRLMTATIPEYYDENYGSAGVYEVKFTGKSSYTGRTEYIDDNGEIRKMPTEVEWSVFVSRGWLKARGKDSISQPDFSALEGWSSHWDLKADVSSDARVNIYATEDDPGDVLNFLKDGSFIEGAAYGRVSQTKTVGG